ncbi:glycosyltransferase [Sulfobacillus harzensis]|uniref:Glycosyltransferase family 4 protein n=1 Tax=Sulfobacillus harzensis TaxID=2729629 RepID=A0A7Y0Q3U1_9FIRM|nr:glycosyltransferase family 4 protein [Sulfobacillus harzensis]
MDGLILDQTASGIGQYVRELMAAYAELFPQDQVEMWLRPDVEVPGVKPHRARGLRTSRQRLWFEQGVLPGLLLRSHYDVAHFPDYQIPLVRQLPRIVMTVHDLAAFVMPEVFPRSKAQGKRMLMKRSVQRAEHIIVPSQATKQDLVNILQVDPDRITVIWHGVKQRGTPPDHRVHPRPYFLAVGTVEPRKNFAGLIRAYHLLLQRREDMPDLLIAGRLGWMYTETLELPEKLGVAENVKFLQYVSEDTLAALYRDAVALVYPSFYEGFGLPVIEAMWDGIPVVTSRQGALAEVGQDAVWAVEPRDPESIADAMLQVLDGGAEVQAKTEKAQSWAHQLTWQRAARLTRAVYDHVSQGG